MDKESVRLVVWQQEHHSSRVSVELFQIISIKWDYTTQNPATLKRIPGGIVLRIQ